MEVCARFELIVIENATALGHDVLEISKRPEVLVGEWLIEDGPEVLGRLKLGRVWGQVDQPDPVRDGQVRCGVLGRVCKPEPDRGNPGFSPVRGKPGFAEEPVNGLRDRTKAGLIRRSRSLQTRPSRAICALPKALSVMGCSFMAY